MMTKLASWQLPFSSGFIINERCYVQYMPRIVQTVHAWFCYMKLSYGSVLPISSEATLLELRQSYQCMMTSSNGSIFLVTGPWWGRSPVNSPHKGQWGGALVFSLICTWINGWVNNGEAGDLRRHRTHYDIAMANQNHVHICGKFESSLTGSSLVEHGSVESNTPKCSCLYHSC